MKKQYRRLLMFTTADATMLIAELAVVPACSAQEHKAVNVSSHGNLPFSDGMVAGNTLYVAGQEGTDDQGKLVSGGITSETKTALDNIQRVVKAAGFELKDIVSLAT